ncbi:hypothetical protein [Candidatus Karelsulcia muelleri]|uniref:hypothetical protein n=1 Tax=Candidatus Karelsulcia muelleri TaxID=336810 RepID=UPI00216AD065|nr:hypothetical protein [Candidatus Karelsulcia muelleri]
MPCPWRVRCNCRISRRKREKNFIETYSLLSEINISYLHVFSYSERRNTKAFIMNNSISQKIRYKRNKIFRRL